MVRNRSSEALRTTPYLSALPVPAEAFGARRGADGLLRVPKPDPETHLELAPQFERAAQQARNDLAPLRDEILERIRRFDPVSLYGQLHVLDSPSSRQFLNPLYLRVEDTACYRHAPLRIRETVDELRPFRGDLVDHDATWQAKLSALELLWSYAPSEERTPDPALARFATFCALAERHGADWRRWPGRAAASGLTRGGGGSRAAGTSRGVPRVAAAVVCRAAGEGQGLHRPDRRSDRRPRRGCRAVGGGGVGAAGRAGTGHEHRRAAEHLQPAGPGLGLATVAS